jgi:ABC-type sugar transport system ATPase subunit
MTDEVADPRPLLSLRGLTRRFGGVRALDGVDFSLRAGEIHALLGENGAGKSTLINILGGVLRPDSGSIELNGRAVEIRDVAEADRLGIRVIHQELSLAPNLTIAENLFLGREPMRFGLVDHRRLRNDARRLIAELDLTEIGSPDTLVAQLSTARQQMVEIARALSVKSRILILDEPTSSLSEAETAALLQTLRRLRAQGVGIIYISHRLEEVSRLADQITVLRDGRRIGTQSAAELDPRTLVRWMVGRDIKDHFPRPPWNPGETVLEARRLRNRWVHDVSFTLRRGEVLGLAGLVGAGRTELARALFGIDPIESGVILIDRQPVAIRSPAEARAHGIVLVPEDRKRQGLVMTGSVAYNLALPWTSDWARGLRYDRSRRAEIIGRALREFAIKAAHPEQPIGSLSGGNQQKVLVGRWMEHPPRVLILDEPTRGVDVGAREEMFTILRRLIDSGMAVLLISSDLPEVMGLSHRLALYRDGRIVREAISAQTTAEQVMAVLTRGETEPL